MDQSTCYEILGVRPGVSPQELKTAHRDLAKVWHPDRFAHDPRLQAKAQERLKEINEAFDQLISKGKRRPVTTPQASYQRRENRRSSGSHLGYWPGMLIAVLMFSVVFFFTLRSIRRGQQQSQIPVATIEQTPALENEERSENHVDAETRELSRVKNKTDAEESIPKQVTEDTAIAFQPVPTATVTIDPLTGKVARRECPTKRTMTYPKGNEPREYCHVHKPLPPLPAERESESRIKSVTKRLVSPSKW